MLNSPILNSVTLLMPFYKFVKPFDVSADTL